MEKKVINPNLEVEEKETVEETEEEEIVEETYVETSSEEEDN